VRLELNVPGVMLCQRAAALARRAYGTSRGEAQSVFLSLRPPAMRGELLRFSNGAALINDKLQTRVPRRCSHDELLRQRRFRRRILAAGEMRELGTASPELHREAGQFAAKTGR